MEILLVEGSENEALLVRKSLSKAGLPHTIRLAKTAEQAIAYLGNTRSHAHKGQNEHTPAVILLDLSLPGMDGFELLKWVRSQPTFNAVRVVVLTGPPHLRDVQRAYELGANSFLTKPLEISNADVLAAVLRNQPYETNALSTTPRAAE